MTKLLTYFATLLLVVFQSNLLFAQIKGSNMPGMATPNKAEPSKLEVGNYVGDVNIFSGNYQNTIQLGTVSTPGGLSYTANLTYNSKNQVTNIPEHVGGIPYGNGWTVSIPSITVKTVSKKIAKKNLNKGSFLQFKKENFTNKELYEDGEPYYYFPFLSIPGEVSGRLILKEKIDERAIFVLEQFEKYVQAEFYNGVWDVILEDGRVFTFDYVKNNSRNAPNNRLDRFKYELVEQDIFALDSIDEIDTVCIKFDPNDPNVCLEDKIITKYAMTKKFHNQLTDLENNISQDLAKTIRPVLERTAWYPSQIYDPAKNDQMIFFQYETYGKINFHQEYLQNNFQFFFLEYVIEDVFGLFQGNTHDSGLFSSWDATYSVPQINLPDLSKLLPYMKPFNKFTEIGFLGNKAHNCGTVFRDIFLKSIVAADMSNGYIPVEKLDLNYQSFDVQNYANSNAHFSLQDANMLLWQYDPYVVRFDSLYSMKAVYQKGHIGDTNYLPFNANGNISFSNSNTNHWTRYRNLRSDEFLRKSHPQVRNYTQFDNANVFDNWNDPNNGNSLINDRNPYALNTNNNLYYFGREKIKPIHTSLSFDHSFLESERINGIDYVPGDNYEIRATIQSNGAQLANYDIELVTGDLNGSDVDDYIGTADPEATINGVNIFSNSGSPTKDYLDPEKVSAIPKSNSFFNTFNNIIKWSSAWSHNSHNKVYTSNNFTFPSLPHGFNGFHVRIGPATSDQFYNFGLKQTDRWDLDDSNSPSQLISNFSNYETYYSHYRNQISQDPSNPQFAWGNHSIHTYSQYRDDKHLRLWDTDPIPNNFGNGSPWYMMDKAQVAGFTPSWLENNWNPKDYFHHRYWWNNYPLANEFCSPNGNPLGSFPNNPTLVSQNTTLNAIQINRMSKNPYVLKEVKKYKLSGYYDYLAEFLEVDTIWNDNLYEHLVFEYDIAQIVNPATYSNSKRNIFLLSEVKRINLDNPNNFIATQFEYQIDPLITTELPCQTFFSNCPTTNTKLTFELGTIVLLNKIIDNLGGETIIEYSEEEHAVFSSNFGELWDFGIINKKPVYNANVSIIPPNIIQEVVYPVSRLGKIDENGIPRYKDYEFEGLITDGNMLQYNLLKLSKYNGASFQQSINGFESATIELPPLDPTMANKRARIEYEHYGLFSNQSNYWTEIPDDHPYFFLGKVKSKKEYDENGQLIKEKIYTYKATKAYANYYHRRKFWTPSSSVCESEKLIANFNPGDQSSAFGEYYDLNLIKDGYGTSHANWYLKTNTADIRVSPFEDQKYIDSYDPPGADSYFIRLIKEEEFDYYPVDQSSDNSNSNHRIMEGGEYGFIQTVKEYSYFDADVYGRSNNDQYKKLLRKGVQGDPNNFIYLSDENMFWDDPSILHNIAPSVLGYRKDKSFQPSWQLSATKSFTSDEPNSYTLSEQYYMFDLQKLYRYKKLYEIYPCEGESFPSPKFINDVSEDAWMIKFHYDNLKRNALFQSVTTHHKPGFDDVKSIEFLTYSDYKNGIISIDPDNYNVEYKNIPQEFCDLLSESGANSSSNSRALKKYPYRRSTYLYDKLKRSYQKSRIWEEYLIDEKGLKIKDLASKDQDVDNVFLNTSVLKSVHIAVDDDRRSEYLNHLYSDHSNTSRVNEDFLFYEDTEVELEVPNIKVRHLPDGSIEYYSDSMIQVITNKFMPVIPYHNIKYADVIGRNRFGQAMIMDDQKELRTLLEFPGRSYTWITDPVKTMKKYEYADVANGDYTIVLKDVTCRYRVMNFGQFGVPDSKIEGFGLEEALKTKYHFDERYNLIKSIDPNQLVTEFKYDGFKRLSETKVNGKITNSYGYNYWNTHELGINNYNFNEKSKYNYLDAFTHYEDSTTLFSRAHYDPLGREFHNATNSFNFDNQNFSSKTIHSGSIVYDAWDRAIKNYKPFKSLNNAVDPLFNFSGYFQENLLEANTRGLTLRTADFGLDIIGSHALHSITEIIDRTTLQSRVEASNTILNEIAPNSEQIFKQLTTIDQDGKKNREYFNSKGQKVAQSNYLENTKINTYYVYDAAGNLYKSINDKGQVREFYYNSLGLMYKKIDPDAGVTLSWFDEKGNLEYLQDENLRAEGNGYIRKMEYDQFGRIITQKKYGLINNISANYDFSTDLKSYSYEGAGAIFQLGNFKYEKRLEYGKPKFVKDYIRDEIFDEYLCGLYARGKLTRTEGYDENGRLIELNHYFYNKNGLQSSYASQFNPEGISASEAGLLNRIYYTYDRQARLINKTIDLNTDGIIDYNYSFLYDQFGRLAEMRSGLNKILSENQKVLSFVYDDVKGHMIKKKYFFHNADLTNSQIDELNYSYEPKRERLKMLDSELMDYRLYYDDDTIGYEQFKPMGSTSFTGEYLTSSNNFNGNINAIQFTTKDQNARWKTFYGYHYDKANRLVKADAFIKQEVSEEDEPSSYSPDGPGSRFKIGDALYQYDDIGNLDYKEIGIWGSNGNIVDYLITDPELLSVNNKFRNANGINNAFTYDNNGNVTMDLINSNVMYYGRANLPHTLVSNGINTTYKYNSSDTRIYKETDDGGSKTGEYYFRDQSNQIIAIFTKNNNGFSNWKHYLYGVEKFGSFDPKPSQEPIFKGFNSVASRAIAQAGNYVLDNTKKYINNSNLAGELLYENLILGGGDVELSNFNYCNSELNTPCLTHEFQDDFLDIKGARVIFKANTVLKPEEGFKIRAGTINIVFGDCEAPNDMLMAYEDSIMQSGTFYQMDHLGNTRLAYKIENNHNAFNRTVSNVIDYYPFGKILREYNLENEKFKFTGKERDAESGYDYFKARLYDSDFGRFLQVDPLGGERANIDPYHYSSNNPIIRIDPDGKWDITIHAFSDRKKHGFGMASVFDRNGNEVMTFRVRLQGAAGSDRMERNSDTPLGTYNIPENSWISGGSRKSYGPNPRLNLSGQSGEIIESGRSAIRIHGGRQETYNSETKTWEKHKNPKLKKTFGCIRAYDIDMNYLKKITEGLENNDEEEKPGVLKIVDDLQERDGNYLTPDEAKKYDETFK